MITETIESFTWSSHCYVCSGLSSLTSGTQESDSGLPSPAPLPVSKNKRVHGSLHRDGDTTGRTGPCVRPLLPPWDLTCTRRNPSSCAETDEPFEARRLRRPLQHRRGVAPANHVPSVGPGRKYDPGRRVTGARPGPASRSKVIGLSLPDAQEESRTDVVRERRRRTKTLTTRRPEGSVRHL